MVYDRRKLTMEHYKETMITLSESVLRNCVQRSLVDIAPWRQFQSARKHHFLGNSACWRWNFCWSVLGKCCFLSIRHWELYTAPPSGIITKTSFRLANKNIIMSETVYDERKLSDEHYYEVGIVKFRLRELLTAPPSGGKMMTSFMICKKIPLSRKWSVINTIWHSAFKLTYGQFESWK